MAFLRRSMEKHASGERYMIRKLPIAVPFLLLLASGSAIALSAAIPLTEADTVIQLLKMMDTDQSGKVSKAEFMTFMSAEFDRLDVDRRGELDTNELAQLRCAQARRPGGTR